MSKLTSKDIRIDIEIINSDKESVTAMQSKLNQWITKGEHIKHEIIDLPDGRLLFHIARRKSESK
jgi:hypothetical protein